MIKNNSMASLVSHAENVLYEIETPIKAQGSDIQKVALQNALNALETLYFMLQEDE